MGLPSIATKRGIAAISACLLLSACSAASSSSVASSAPARASSPAAAEGTRPTHSSRPATPVNGTTTGGKGVAFTVAGNHPVPATGGQDTHAQTPTASCDSKKFTADKALGHRVASGFSLAGFTASADLLGHFLTGRGTEIDYRAGSPISRAVAASSAFRTVNEQVQKAIRSQLKDGRASVQLPAAQLPTVEFEAKATDLYWGFRGTQGLTVTGSGHRAHGRFTGSLSYVIRDSYGFPAGDRLGGFGAPMRYLQTACGAPQQAGGAHWFPDTISVTVPFNLSA